MFKWIIKYVFYKVSNLRIFGSYDIDFNFNKFKLKFIRLIGRVGLGGFFFCFWVLRVLFKWRLGVCFNFESGYVGEADVREMESVRNN